MRKCRWAGDDKEIRVTLAVYDKKSSFLAACKRLSHSATYPDTQGMAVVRQRCDYKQETPMEYVEVFILLRSGWCTPGVFAHECTHAAQRLTEILPKRRIVDTEETQCCYVDTLVDLFDPWLRKNKLYRKRKNNWHKGLMW